MRIRYNIERLQSQLLELQSLFEKNILEFRNARILCENRKRKSSKGLFTNVDYAVQHYRFQKLNWDRNLDNLQSLRSCKHGIQNCLK